MPMTATLKIQKNGQSKQLRIYPEISDRDSFLRVTQLLVGNCEEGLELEYTVGTIEESSWKSVANPQEWQRMLRKVYLNERIEVRITPAHGGAEAKAPVTEGVFYVEDWDRDKLLQVVLKSFAIATDPIPFLFKLVERFMGPLPEKYYNAILPKKKKTASSFEFDFDFDQIRDESEPEHSEEELSTARETSLQILRMFLMENVHTLTSSLLSESDYIDFIQALRCFASTIANADSDDKLFYFPELKEDAQECYRIIIEHLNNMKRNNRSTSETSNHSISATAIKEYIVSHTESLAQAILTLDKKLVLQVFNIQSPTQITTEEPLSKLLYFRKGLVNALKQVILDVDDPQSLGVMAEKVINLGNHLLTLGDYHACFNVCTLAGYLFSRGSTRILSSPLLQKCKELLETVKLSDKFNHYKRDPVIPYGNLGRRHTDGLTMTMLHRVYEYKCALVTAAQKESKLENLLLCLPQPKRSWPTRHDEIEYLG